MTADRKIFEKFNNNKVFLETGSLLGGGINQAYHAGYRKIISIELSEYYYTHCKKLFSNHSSIVSLYHGDSGKILGDVISKINEPITFWLDGHYSGNVDNHAETAKGEVESPLLQELNFIDMHPIRNHSILIDDVNPSGGDASNGIPLNTIIEKLIKINPDYKIEYFQLEEKDAPTVLGAYVP